MSCRFGDGGPAINPASPRRQQRDAPDAQPAPSPAAVSTHDHATLTAPRLTRATPHPAPHLDRSQATRLPPRVRHQRRHQPVDVMLLGLDVGLAAAGPERRARDRADAHQAGVLAQPIAGDVEEERDRR